MVNLCLTPAMFLSFTKGGRKYSTARLIVVSVEVYPVDKITILDLCFDTSRVCIFEETSFYMEKWNIHSAALSGILLVMLADLKLHENLEIKNGL